jgi:hypothetical protein
MHLIMIEFRSLSKHNDWEIQPSFYIHGKLVNNKQSDLVTINSDNLNAVSMYYKEGKSLPIWFYDIPTGMHLCLLDDQVCALFTWKTIRIAKDGMVQFSPDFVPMSYDIELRQLGLIVDFNDAKGIHEAVEKFNSKAYII